MSKINREKLAEILHEADLQGKYYDWEDLSGALPISELLTFLKNLSTATELLDRVQEHKLFYSTSVDIDHYLHGDIWELTGKSWLKEQG